jgi:hypothetical protein
VPSFEVLLVLGVFGLYCYDSLMLLNFNELIFIRFKKKWSYKFPILSFQLLRKFPFLPNLLTPNIALFQVFWPTCDQDVNFKEFDIFIKSLIPVQVISVILLVLMFVCLPIVAFKYGSGTNLLIVFFVIYILIISILIYLFTQKNNLKLSNTKLVSVTFESIVCPPFALNIVRKISLNYPMNVDPYIFTKEMFDEETKKSFKKNLCIIIDKKMNFLEKDSERFIELNNYLNQIQSEKEN